MSNKPHILVVDDDNRILKLLKKFLSQEGLLVSTSTSTNEAVELQPKTNSSDDTQTWIRGKTNSKGYFTLQSKAHGKLLTLVTSSRIILAGTIFILILNIQDKLHFTLSVKSGILLPKLSKLL